MADTENPGTSPVDTKGWSIEVVFPHGALTPQKEADIREKVSKLEPELVEAVAKIIGLDATHVHSKFIKR
jgi:hypothetical protein